MEEHVDVWGALYMSAPRVRIKIIKSGFVLLCKIEQPKNNGLKKLEIYFLCCKRSLKRGGVAAPQSPGAQAPSVFL